ncbi:hypothetical protein D8M04_08335 [Oceanobacillus piezotolerans]|uniref:Uncharacterized protein n=1 Tax=Oceanobacillus piezotolerans TaxID=2448030 RepID=A0A498DA31_9BACI|nr:YppG family protein [Oceanobacillus piezotolerans]RLL44880.1 hypothetical protein D8M04_08335 [Oceanobacillus piezotolerans]
MFMERPRRRPAPQRRPFSSRRPVKQEISTSERLLSMFQDDDGNLDFEKMTGTFHKLNDIYGQVSPLITRFRKK